MEEGSYNLIFPVPRDGRSPAQRWWAKHRNPDLFYLQGPWGICGEAWIYGDDAQPIHRTNAELRFGEHPYMRSFHPLCLAVNWDGDDKHALEFPRAYENVISGMIHGRLVVFRPNPFQTQRLKRLRDQGVDIPYISVLIGNHMMKCEKLIKGI